MKAIAIKVKKSSLLLAIKNIATINAEKVGISQSATVSINYFCPF